MNENNELLGKLEVTDIYGNIIGNILFEMLPFRMSESKLLHRKLDTIIEQNDKIINLLSKDK